MEEMRSLPKVDALSRAAGLQAFPERVRVEAARLAIEEMRGAIRSKSGLNGHSAEELAVARAQALTQTSLAPAINLSGVVLHTGLGRARLAKAAVDHIANVAANHSLLELDDESGKRGDRQSHVRELLQKLTGAEDVLVVNNAAAAVVVTLASLAKGKDVILSRGQMVEIGGSFRMPEIVRESGCNLVEVGCTNKTRIGDYESVLSDQTGCILRCHTSNFKIIGFTEQAGLQELVKLAHSKGVACVDDMGTGCIVDTSRFGMPKVPTIQDSIRAGADIVIASGDKLLGGPQAGLIVGNSRQVGEIKKHPLARAMRIDKLTLAGLESTLRLYAEGREGEIPTIAYLSRSFDEVKGLAAKLAACVKDSFVDEGVTEVGGGSAPGTGVKTWRVGLRSPNADAIAAKLRLNGRVAILSRIEDGIVWLDPRTLDANEVEQVCEVLKSL
jgi:L-seryl-tRNA(Ser) seleniumtransferase